MTEIYGAGGWPSAQTSNLAWAQNRLAEAYKNSRIPEADYLRGIGKSFVNGATLGFGDNIWNAGMAAKDAFAGGDFSDSYRRRQEAYHDDLNRFREEHGADAAIAEGVGGLVQLVPAVRLANWAGKGLSNLARASKSPLAHKLRQRALAVAGKAKPYGLPIVGGFEGGLYSVGDQLHDGEEFDWTRVPRDMLIGTALGGALLGAGRGAKYVGDRLPPSVKTWTGDQVRRYAPFLNPSRNPDNLPVRMEDVHRIDELLRRPTTGATVAGIRVAQPTEKDPQREKADILARLLRDKADESPPKPAWDISNKSVLNRSAGSILNDYQLYSSQNRIGRERVDEIKVSMLDQTFDFAAAKNQVGGFYAKDTGEYFVNDGHHRFTAAAEIASQTGDMAMVEGLRHHGSWHSVETAREAKERVGGKTKMAKAHA